MARVTPVVLETKTFDHRAQAKDYFKDMLGRYKLGDTVSAEDAADLNALIATYKGYDAKRAGGIERFEVVRTEFAGLCFEAVGVDGEAFDVSYKKCIEQYGK